KRTVGLRQKAIERHPASGVPQVVGLRKRNDASQRDVEAERQAGVRQRRTSGETVQYAAQPAATLFAQNPQRVVVGLARVNHDRNVELAGEAQLAAEDRVLHLARRVVVMVVEADLTNR